MTTHKTSTREQNISTILDDHFDQQELDAFMQDLKRDPVADAECVRRYQMMGDVLRDDLNEVSFMDISAAVHRAIDQEPELNATTEKVSAPLFNASRFNLSSWLRPLTGIAIAASMAMVTVVSVRIIETDSADDSAQAVVEANVELKTPAVVPVNPLIANQVRLASTAKNETKAQLQARQLSDYMMRHSGSAGQTTVQGMVPYVRVVGFGSNQQK